MKNSSKTNAPAVRLPDQGQRDLIVRELEKNILVEAAAGTGKTTCLLARMIALLGSGTCTHIRHMAAVTFTRKAAAELRARFQIGLEKALRSTDGSEKKNLERALAQIEQCFIGTIHSFCARLLRERPVEAGVDLGFEELDEEGDTRVRTEAWEEYAASLMADDREGILTGLDQLGLRLADLEGTFGRFADFPDVEEWPVPSEGSRLPEVLHAVEEVLNYVDHMESLAPLLPEETGNDTLIREYRRLPRIVSHYDDLNRVPDLMEVLRLFEKNAKVIHKEWMKGGHFTRDDAKREQVRWDDFRERVAQPLLRAWRECRYGPVLRIMREVTHIYDRLRQDRGVLNYQDLLIKAAGLLRDKPHVRRYFQDRYTHLLVDEFQDTDPIQAEVMLLLTTGDTEKTNWRDCTPRPGSLFVVGDPKQSIYRFRRADIVTYNEVKEIIRKGGGEASPGLIVELSSNFRTTRQLIEWVNQVFEPRLTEADCPEASGTILHFPEKGSDESPGYVALQAGRVDGNTGMLDGLYTLHIPEEYSNKDLAAEYEADLIARTIRHALDSGMTISRTGQQIEEGVPERVNPPDFLIITRGRALLSTYARKLQAYGIPYQVTGGSALNEVSELELLRRCLAAVVHPDNPVALVGALRSELFGISDAALYDFKKADGRFSYSTEVPEGLCKEDTEAFKDTFARLKTYAGWLSRLPPVAAVEKIVADLGLMVLATTRPGGDIEAGSLAKAIEVLRSVQPEMWTTAQIVEYLARLAHREERYDGISARSEEQPAVRIMNLHKVKGLESPVVFLADPFGDVDHGVDLHINRSGDRVLGYMAVNGPKKGYGTRPRLAQPPDWEMWEEKEKRFLEAEALRLRYVAATRAGAAMIISQKAARNSSNPWQYFAEYLPADSVLPDPGQVGPPIRKEIMISADEVREAQDAIASRLAGAARATCSVVGAKEYALSLPREELRPAALQAPERQPSVSPPLADVGEHGVEWGTVIHSLLQLVMQDQKADLISLARSHLSDQELDPALAEQAVETVNSVMRSEVWQRALKSAQRFTEVPFEILLEEDTPVPTVVRGVIDLIFKEDDAWVLVDYKTDLLNGRQDVLVEKYTPQVHFYARAWEKCTGEPVKERLLYFIYSRSLQAV